MTPEQAKQLLPIITAYAEGATIEIYQFAKWKPITNPEFTGNPSNYRIKPKPILAKAYLHKNGILDIDIEANWTKCQSNLNFWKWVSEPFEITDQSC